MIRFYLTLPVLALFFSCDTEEQTEERNIEEVVEEEVFMDDSLGSELFEGLA